jgi:hypothetical protein
MPVNAVRFIRKMRGGAQAHLLEADDGNFYIVKFQNNPQHRRILVNEMLASGILAHLQISAPPHQIVNLTPEFLEANPEVHLQTGTRHTPVQAGWHFGSKHPGDPNTLAIYCFIPETLLHQVANAEQFLAVLAFDLWVSNADGRQCVFFRALLNDWLARPGVPPRKLGFVTLMIDHGFAFNGPNWNLPDSSVSGLYARRLVYRNVRSLKDFEPWIDRIVNFPPEVLDKAMRQIPPQWVDRDADELERLMDALLRRCKRVPDLLNLCRQAAGNPFPLWN